MANMAKKKKRLSNAESRAAYEQREQARLAKKHRRYRNIWLGIGGGICAAGLVIGGCIGVQKLVVRNGYCLHDHIAAQTEHYEINSAMLSYYFSQAKTSYDLFLKDNPNEEGYDPKVSLREQEYKEGTTWFDFLMDSTMSSIEQTLKTCEAAYDAGFTLSAERQEEVRKDAAAVDLSALQKGVTREDVEQVMQMQAIARDYQQQRYDEIKITNEEIKTEAEKNERDYQMFSILCYTFEWQQGEIMAGSEAGRNKALARADALAACKSKEEFEEYVKDYLEKETEYSAESREQQLRAMRLTTGYASYNDEVQKWVEGAKPFDTYIYKPENGTFAEVMMLLDRPALDNSECVDLRVIYLPASAYNNDIDATVKIAEQLMQECDKAEDSRTAFIERAGKYSMQANASSGGLIEGYSRVRTTYGAETADWLFEAGRKQGDMFLCKRESAVIIAYYEAENERCGWQNQAYSKLLNNRIGALSAELASHGNFESRAEYRNDVREVLS